MQIRPAESKDETSISEMFYGLYPNFKAAKDTLAIDTIDAKCINLVAENDNEVTGFVIGTFITYGPCKYGYIEELYVKEIHRRKGVGKKLIIQMLDEYEKLGVWALFVMTKEDDPVAQAFYRNMGFTKSKGYWLYKEW